MNGGSPDSLAVSCIVCEVLPRGAVRLRMNDSCRLHFLPSYSICLAAFFLLFPFSIPALVDIKLLSLFTAFYLRTLSVVDVLFFFGSSPYIFYHLFFKQNKGVSPVSHGRSTGSSRTVHIQPTLVLARPRVTNMLCRLQWACRTAGIWNLTTNNGHIMSWNIVSYLLLSELFFAKALWRSFIQLRSEFNTFISME